MKYPYEKICFDCAKKYLGRSVINEVKHIYKRIKPCPVCGKHTGTFSPTAEGIKIKIPEDTIFTGVHSRISEE